MLASSLHEHSFTGEGQLQELCLVCNTSMHPTTGQMHFCLIIGCQVQMLIDCYPPAIGSTPICCTASCKTGGCVLPSMWISEVEIWASEGAQWSQSPGDPYKPEDLVWLHCPVSPTWPVQKVTCTLSLVGTLSHCVEVIRCCVSSTEHMSKMTMPGGLFWSAYL